MRTGRRAIANGDKYNSLFPKPRGNNVLLKREATLEDTIPAMKRIIAETLGDTKAIARLLKAPTEDATLKNIWEFCFNHLQYEKDAKGKEQLRRPSRTWHDRKKGVDCDCMTIFIGSILTNLGIPFTIRLTKYEQTSFEHVYPIAHIK